MKSEDRCVGFNGSFDNPFFQDKKIVKIDCKWKGQEYSKDAFGFTHAEYVCSFILKENPEAEIVLVPIVRKNKKRVRFWI